MKLVIPVLLSFAGASLAPSPCTSDNCLCAIAATRDGISFQAQATNDCWSFVGQTITPPPLTTTVTGIAQIVSSNTTTRSTGNEASATPTWAGIPAYASACSSAAGYSSACACIGISQTNTALPAWTVTVTVPPPPSASTTAPCNTTNALTDPNNCGTCGNVCSSGACTNGACNTTSCDLATCGSFNTCGAQSQACFCFSDLNSVGFCSQNAVCASLTSCTADARCLPGYICAINTCCGAGGACILAACGNPATKLLRAAKRFHEGTLNADTAAFLGA